MGYTPPYLNVRKVAGGIAVDPGGVTTDDLTIYPNSTDLHARIKLDGTGNVLIVSASAGGIAFGYDDAGTPMLTFNYGASEITASLMLNRDFFLQPTGTGVLKFGTFTSDATVTQSGYITIKDSGGTTRYLSCITP